MECLKTVSDLSFISGKTVSSYSRESIKAKWSKYPNHKSELVSHLNIVTSEIFDAQTRTLKQRFNQQKN